MAKIIKGDLKGKGIKLGVVVSQFNDFITSKLLDGCLEELSKNGVKKTDATVVFVPGAWEIPVVALQLAKNKNIDGVICLGAVIRGETAHFDFVARGACDGIQKVALSTGKPVVLGVLTTDTIDQAYKRSNENNNKGCDVAKAVLEMVDVFKKLKKI
ncbi:MAG: 6,7-dimethyl-8-ribityllumazine synthase [Candidatus Omnitrophica bacterium]|nr:6,7-dimethyl-8-ribityllumazine synthase [Candidatus Omnitrophota bacterium]